MKRLFVSLLMVAAILPATIYAGGIVTNTNQSASFIRMPAQDATIGIEGTYYNPAGLVHLENGFYISVSSQTVMQTREISSTFNMNKQEFQGDVFAPVFPTFYAVYKKDKVAYSFGVNPIGGGGSAKFETGLPSFEQMVAVLPTSLTAGGIPTTQYSMKSSFNGSSLNWGFQFNASYSLTDMISLSLGFRYVVANNTYEGYLKDVMINPNQPAFGAQYNGGSMVSAPLFFTDASNTLAGWAAGANSYFAGLEPIVSGGGGGVLLVDGAGAGLTPLQIAQIQGLLGAAGLTPAQIGAIDIQTAQATLGAAAPAFTANSNAMAANAAATANKEVDASQSSSGISPIIGVNFKFSESLNVAVKYEHKTNMTLTNKTTLDDVGLYPDGAKTPNDMPSLLVVGVGYRPMDKLFVTGGLHYYFDKNAKYGKKIGGVFVDNEEVMDGNSWEASLGLEYSINDAFLVSAGYLLTKTGANDLYHSDLSHSLNTSSVGFGGKYMINDRLGLNLGFMYTMYNEYTKEFVGYNESYNRKAMVGAIGFDYKF
ncbi:MAG: aromatic hydrocarbon degradation protein [Bacteroidales bacterium]|nr:aromatic hydrocarbon degradation protein [Bacteroidales bacterium]MDY0197179.1 aromatic hydrocarbon degradation protein [Tenuifilaceae bacterium]